MPPLPLGPLGEVGVGHCRAADKRLSMSVARLPQVAGGRDSIKRRGRRERETKALRNKPSLVWNDNSFFVADPASLLSSAFAACSATSAFNGVTTASKLAQPGH